MQYVNDVVKAHKVQTVKLTLYEYKQILMTKQLDDKRSSSVILGCQKVQNFNGILIK